MKEREKENEREKKSKRKRGREGGVGDYLHVAFIEVNSLHFMAYPKAERGYNS